MDRVFGLMYTDLTYVNLSYDTNYPRVIVLQRNLEWGYEQSAVAWKVIRNCGYEWSHPFRFHWQLSVDVQDEMGNKSCRVPVGCENIFYFVRTKSGGGVLKRSPTSQPGSISIVNQTRNERITANVYRGDRLLAVRPFLGSGEEARFRFNRCILLGTGLRVEEGQVLDPRRLMDFKTEIDTVGIRAARIIMTGGGPGPYSRPLQFQLIRNEAW